MTRIRHAIGLHIGKIAYTAVVCGCWVGLAACGQTDALPYLLSFLAPFFALGVIVLFGEAFF